METDVTQHLFSKGGYAMPPKPIIDKNDILNAALELVREKGIEYINARSLAKTLNCSTKPLFRIYENMEDLKKDIFSKADEYLGNYLVNYNSEYDNKLINIGLAYVEFAKNEPNLFRLIYLSGNLSFSYFKQFIYAGKGTEIFSCISESVDEKVSLEDRKNLYLQTLIYAHGLATLIATNEMGFSQDVLAHLLANAYISFRDNISHLDVLDEV